MLQVALVITPVSNNNQLLNNLNLQILGKSVKQEQNSSPQNRGFGWTREGPGGAATWKILGIAVIFFVVNNTAKQSAYLTLKV